MYVVWKTGRACFIEMVSEKFFVLRPFLLFLNLPPLASVGLMSSGCEHF